MDTRVDSLKARMADILETHFDNHQNPHETILQMWTLLNTDSDRGVATGFLDQTVH